MRTPAIIVFLLMAQAAGAQNDFGEYFTEKTLRFDFLLAGNSIHTEVYPVEMKEEPYWSGPRKIIPDLFNYGNFKYEVFETKEGNLLYSRGFSTLFQEWQTTAEAKIMKRSFHEMATMPWPKDRIRFVLSERKQNGKFTAIYETIIDPADNNIRREAPVRVNTTRINNAGDPSVCLDLAFIAEGYTMQEMNMFREDVKKFSGLLLKEEPFSEYRNRINIWAVECPSQESGTDIPTEGIYVNTALNSTFNTFGTERYLTTTDIKAVNDYAASVPHDNIIILFNTERYGGGGVYNYYSGTSAGHTLSPIVFIHEFGHGFAGLADEYYTSDVAYEEFYPHDVEPWEPNITTRVNFDSKWKALLTEGIPLPTPDEPKYKDATGLFEGGGYSTKGIFRPQSDCRMKSNGPKGFCTVCRNAIRKMLEYYTEGSVVR
jgi:hypothetical protein